LDAVGAGDHRPPAPERLLLDHAPLQDDGAEADRAGPEHRAVIAAAGLDDLVLHDRFETGNLGEGSEHGRIDVLTGHELALHRLEADMESEVRIWQAKVLAGGQGDGHQAASLKPAAASISSSETVIRSIG